MIYGYRISDIHRVTLNGVKVKLFKYFIKVGDAFVFQGAYSAPVKTSNRNLYRHVKNGEI